MTADGHMTNPVACMPSASSSSACCSNISRGGSRPESAPPRPPYGIWNAMGSIAEDGEE